MAWLTQDPGYRGLKNIPGIPKYWSNWDYDDMVLFRLRKRQGETGPALDGLTVEYTIGDHKASARDFLIGDSKLKALSLDDPRQFAMSWTTYKDVYPRGMSCLPQYTDPLTRTSVANELFWRYIADYGAPYNLLILRRVTDARLGALKTLFGASWHDRLESVCREGRLYEIDFSMFESIEPWRYQEGGQELVRCNPATLTLLERSDSQSPNITPIMIRVGNSGDNPSPPITGSSRSNPSPPIMGGFDQSPQIYEPNKSAEGAWLYALQAAKTSVMLYGVWLGHVYHWHIVTAAMQQTMYETIGKSHPIYRLLQPQSNFLTTFDHLLLGDVDLPLGMGKVFDSIAPPSSLGNAMSILKLMDQYAEGRQFFDDDPKAEIARNGLDEAQFSLGGDRRPWSDYPVAQYFLQIWDICEKFVTVFVSTTYPDNPAVAGDTELQNWMKAAADPKQGNIRGLPAMDNKTALTRVLTSLIYRVTVHGISRLVQSANPVLTYVANFPPCLQRPDLPRPDSNLSTKELLTYLPNAGTIGSMLKFYFAFVFSKPYVPLIPAGGLDQALYFDGGVSEPRNAALIAFRKGMQDFMRSYQPWPGNPDFGPRKPARLQYGDLLRFQNGHKNWNGGFLDTRGSGCNNNLLCVSTSESFERDHGSGTWKIISATGKKEGMPVAGNDFVYLQNQSAGNGGYLDTRGSSCEDNLLCVSTSTDSNRDNGSGTWKIITDYPGEIQEGHIFRLLNGYNNWNGGYLDTRGPGSRCQDNLLCVSTSASMDRDDGSTHWRCYKSDWEPDFGQWPLNIET